MQFNNRFKFIDSLLNIINKTSINNSSCLFGKFIMDYLFFKDMSESCDIIDIYFTSYKLGEFDLEQLKFDFMLVSCNLENKHKYIEKYKLVSSFNFINMYKVPTLILRYEYINSNIKDSFYVNLMAYQPKCIGNFSHYLLKYSSKKFDSMCSLDLNKIIELYLNNQAIYSIDLKQIQDKAFPNKSIPRYLKQKFLSILIYNLEIIYNFIIQNPSIKILNSPKLFIENNEDCVITGDEKPYLKLNLECNHAISLQVYKGIVLNKLEYSEYIRCPFCRSDLRVKFDQ